MVLIILRCRGEQASAGEGADEGPGRRHPAEPTTDGEHGGGQRGERVAEFGALDDDVGQQLRGKPGSVLDTLPI